MSKKGKKMTVKQARQYFGEVVLCTDKDRPEDSKCVLIGYKATFGNLVATTTMPIDPSVKPYIAWFFGDSKPISIESFVPLCCHCGSKLDDNNFCTKCTNSICKEIYTIEANLNTKCPECGSFWDIINNRCISNCQTVL